MTAPMCTLTYISHGSILNHDAIQGCIFPIDLSTKNDKCDTSGNVQ